MALPRELVRLLIAHLSLTYVEQHSQLLSEKWLHDFLQVRGLTPAHFADMPELSLLERAHYALTARGESTSLSLLFFPAEFHVANAIHKKVNDDKKLKLLINYYTYFNNDLVLSLALMQPHLPLAETIFAEGEYDRAVLLRLFVNGAFPAPPIRPLLLRILPNYFDEDELKHLCQLIIDNEGEVTTDDYHGPADNMHEYEKLAAELNIQTTSDITLEEVALQNLSYRALKQAGPVFPRVQISNKIPPLTLQARAAPMAARVRALYPDTLERAAYLQQLDFILHPTTNSVHNIPLFLRVIFDRMEEPFPLIFHADHTRPLEVWPLYPLLFCPNLPRFITICAEREAVASIGTRQFFEILHYVAVYRGFAHLMLPCVPTLRRLHAEAPQLSTINTDENGVPMANQLEIADYSELRLALARKVPEINCANYFTMLRFNILPTKIIPSFDQYTLIFRIGTTRIRHPVFHIQGAEAWVERGVKLDLKVYQERDISYAARLRELRKPI